MGSFGLEDPCDYGMEEELERMQSAPGRLRAALLPHRGRVPGVARRHVDEGELRARRAREVAGPVDDDSYKEDPPQPGEPM